jgi:hypothetical protein
MPAGKVTRIEDFGLGFVKHEETNEQFAFTFDKIEGYRGERPSQLGFRVGADVTFHLQDGLIDGIQLGNALSIGSGLSAAVQAEE